MSEFVNSLSKLQNLLSPSRLALGGSFNKTLNPKVRAKCSTFEPTIPTPTIPIVDFFGSTPFKIKCAKMEAIYCFTDSELHPGAFAHSIPALSSQDMSR